MSDDDIEKQLSQVRRFSWDESKRQSILQKRDIDFDDARIVIDGPLTDQIGRAKSAT